MEQQRDPEIGIIMEMFVNGKLIIEKFKILIHKG